MPDRREATPPSKPGRPTREYVRHYGYGLVLILILTSLIFQMAASDSDVVQAMVIVLQALTLLVAVWASQARHVVVRITEFAVGAIVVVAALVFIASGEVDDGSAKIINLLLLAFAPLTIAAGIVRHFREEGAVTIRTMFGVLCIYLLLGSIFAFTYGAIGALSNEPFFAETQRETSADFLYFSFTTLTTTGFGDLTAHANLGRSFAIMEALFGQIYLVTVVAVIVGNLRPARRRGV